MKRVLCGHGELSVSTQSSFLGRQTFGRWLCSLKVKTLFPPWGNLTLQI